MLLHHIQEELDRINADVNKSCCIDRGFPRNLPQSHHIKPRSAQGSSKTELKGILCFIFAHAEEVVPI